MTSNRRLPPAPVPTPAPSPEDLLRQAGLRVTAPRVTVLHELGAHRHADVETIARAARVRLGKVSTQAVYDVLRVLVERGLVRRIEPAGSPARYEPQTGDNHHHVVCRGCGLIDDVDCATGEAPCLDASDDRGFAIDEAEVVYWGLCPRCRDLTHADGAAAPSASTRHTPEVGTAPGPLSPQRTGSPSPTATTQPHPTEGETDER